MFLTATTPLPSNSSVAARSEAAAHVPITLQQFTTIVKNLNNSIDLKEVLHLYISFYYIKYS